MDGLRGVWHGGPFARTTRYVFYPRQIMFGTDPVAIDRLLLDIIEDKRKAEGVHLGLGPLAGVAARSTTRARGTPIPTSTSSSGSRATSSTPRRSASASTTARRSRCRTSPYDAARAGGPGLAPVRLLDAGHRQPRRARSGRASGVSASPPTRSSVWRAAGFSVSPVTTADLASREALPAPGVTPRAGIASPTRTPWIVAERLAFHATARRRDSSTSCRPARPRSPRLRRSPTAPTPC